MTATLTDAGPTTPTFPACPPWCDQLDMHDPHGEVGHHHGVSTLDLRVHEVELPRVTAASVRHIADVDISVRVFREDGGTYGDNPEQGVPTAEVGVFEHPGHSVIFRPTADQLRAMAAKYTAAADLLEGVTR